MVKSASHTHRQGREVERERGNRREGYMCLCSETDGYIDISISKYMNFLIVDERMYI